MAANDELVAFIRAHINSVWTLELLCLLRADPDRQWSPEALVAELRGSHALVSDGLRRLENAGIVLSVEPGFYRYLTASSTIDQMCDALVSDYRARPVAITNIIVSSPDKLQILADAFRLRGPGK